MEANPAIEGCLNTCRRCDEVARILLGETHRNSPDLWNAVCEHLRHCIDHYRCFLRGLAGGTVDYDARDRDPELEINPQKVREALAEIVLSLQTLVYLPINRTINVVQSSAPDRKSAPMASTIERELAFLSSHTIHHLALVILIARKHGLELPGELGVAYSTASHRESGLAAARA